MSPGNMTPKFVANIEITFSISLDEEFPCKLIIWDFLYLLPPVFKVLYNFP
jgi:hypothetical protein